MDVEATGDDSSAAVGVPVRSPALLAILASTAIIPLGVPMLSPILPVIRDHFGVGDPVASLVITTYFLPAVLLSPLIGVAVDRVGRRPVLVASLLAWAVAGLVVGVGPAFDVVLLLRLVQGTAAASVLIVTVTLIGDRYTGIQRSAVIGGNVAALMVGAAVAPLVGGVLVEYGWNVPFLLFAVGFPVALFVLYAIAEPERSPSRGGVEYLRGAVAALPLGPAIGLYGAAATVEFVGFGAIVTAVPFVLAGDGVSPVVIGAVITANLVAGAAVAANNGWFAKHLRNGQLVSAGFVLGGAGLLVAVVAEGPLQFAGATAAFGVGYGLTFPSVDAQINAIVPSTHRAGALSLRNSATFLGRGAGPVAFTTAAAVVGYRPVLAAAGGLVLVLGLLAVPFVGGVPGRH